MKVREGAQSISSGSTRFYFQQRQLSMISSLVSQPHDRREGCSECAASLRGCATMIRRVHRLRRARTWVLVTTCRSLSRR